MISSVEKTVLVGKYVDFKDNTTYEWQVGFVVSQTGNKVKVRSEGWSDKYDEVPVNWPRTSHSPPIESSPFDLSSGATPAKRKNQPSETIGSTAPKTMRKDYSTSMASDSLGNTKKSHGISLWEDRTIFILTPWWAKHSRIHRKWW